MNPDIFIGCLLAVNTGVVGWSALQSIKNGNNIARIKLALNILLSKQGEKFRV